MDDDLFDCLVSSCVVPNLKERRNVSSSILKFLFENPYGRDGDFKFCVVQALFAKKDFKKLRELSELLLENEDAELILLAVKEMISAFYYFYNYFENDPNCLKEMLEIISIYSNFSERSFTIIEVLSIVKLLNSLSKDIKSFIKIYDHLLTMNTKAIGLEMENELFQDSIVQTAIHFNTFESILQRKNYKDSFTEMCKNGSIFDKIWSKVIKYDDTIQCFRLVYQHVEVEQFESRMNNIRKVLGLKNFQLYLKNSNLQQLTQTVMKQCASYKETSPIKRKINFINNYLNQITNQSK
ncbi:predicted protein [Naegleria gruberi]|uniref:Predicted protein n=1 Tax=Naegleria gruberi TaxID=5762 RepID=D2VEA3_NAEGR|nr:uncharacterized protein NAEGRDRAFT_67206 [Naegleria gruberi]EFC44846.1 predicted protein [Naegleria gruberi]|eukprot:XP_002677590.1 predicted protein [Naegleria gruberi strain NEG-M]